MEKSSHSIPENYTVSIPITSRRGDSKFWSLMENELEPDSHVFNCILDCLSVKDIFELSLSCKEMRQLLLTECYYWNKRAHHDFGIGIVTGDSLPNNLEAYVNEYKRWSNEQRFYSILAKREEDVEKMLTLSIRLGRFLYVYETYIVFLGLPITLVLFTILMMLYLNNHFPFPVSYIYYVFYFYMVLVFPFLSLPGLYIRANTKKVISPMWFLSHFNSNLIFNLMKSDYVTRTKRESQSSAKFISNNEVVFTDNAHYHLLLCQILVVYFGIFANLYLFNLFQTEENVSKYYFIAIEWFFTICYMLAMHLKMNATGIMKDEDKWEYAYFYLFLLQLTLLTVYLITGWPSLFWTLFPLILSIGIVLTFLVIVFIGLFRISMKGVYRKRYMTGTAIVAVFSLFLFFIHLVDRYGRHIPRPTVLLCIEFIIPEVCSFLPVCSYLTLMQKHKPRIFQVNNYEIIHNHEYLDSITQTHFDLRLRLHQLVQTESRLLRTIICSQLFKSFIQNPSITDSPYFPRITELIAELRNDPHPDILHAVHVLRDTGLCFSPLLQCIISEIIDGEPRPMEGNDDGIDVPLLNEMHDGSVRGLPAVNPLVATMIETPAIPNADQELETVLFSLLEEASFEDRYNRL